jgi:pyruvate formate lyase activating enzyme
MPDVLFKEILTRHTKEGNLYTRLSKDWVRCFACGHRCKLPPGKEGICKIRFNKNGKLYVPSGYVSGIALDPIEKKPFFHAFPGSRALSFGMLGCDYHCSFCQNWMTSQTLRDPQAVSSIEEIDAEEIVKIAIRERAPVITSTYNEPLITSEWAVEVFTAARKAGLITSYVSNGNGTPEVLDYLQPWIDLYKIDLKGFRQKTYQGMGGVLQDVLDTIKAVFHRKIWIEVVTLVIPGINDSDEELADIAKFLCSVSPDIPWHVTGYYQNYKMTVKEDATPSSTLLRAAEIGYKEGLHFVYTGNRPGLTRNYENTYCFSCNALLIERMGYRVLRNRMRGTTCFECGQIIPGRWGKIIIRTDKKPG